MSRGAAKGSSTVLKPGDIGEARRAGFRYLVVYRAGFDVLTQAGIKIDRYESIQRLKTAFGPPIVDDDMLVVFSLESAL
jgi:hypothetical protein